MPDLEFYFDCSSPWTYLAFENAQPLCVELGVGIDWKPFLVGGVFNTVNDSVYKFRQDPVPAKKAYVTKDLADWARHSGLTITWEPTVFPVNSVKAMRGCLVALEEGRLVDFARAAFEAYWRDDRDISQDDVVADLAGRAGLDPQDLFARIATPEIKARLRENTETAIARGAFGSPTLFVGDDMYFGNDRLPLVRAALKRAKG